jgi:xanthine dehydrogenase YagS FAD-binding subunit
MRLKSVEDAVRGRSADASTGEAAGKLAVEGAVPLQFNGYKIPLMRNLVKRAIVGAAEPSTNGVLAANALAEEATCRS